jgi:hypothetical protein
MKLGEFGDGRLRGTFEGEDVHVHVQTGQG